MLSASTIARNEFPSRRRRDRRLGRSFTLVEVVVAVFLLSMLVVALFSAFLSGLTYVQITREDLRATQILMQKMEVIRLFTWNQTTNTSLANPVFTDFYDPSGVGTGQSGALYRGYVSISPITNGFPADYQQNIRLVTATVYWTNFPGGKSKSVARSRQMQTLVARRGMQNYVYQ